ncbi:hypothetical protein BYT27DRAFT_7212677 [Phlegmacium glaucopus]|nr:hypothetical protein BYT27DRAFT_7212677 [Phlegmacium glaucopus]
MAGMAFHMKTYQIYASKLWEQLLGTRQYLKKMTLHLPSQILSGNKSSSGKRVAIDQRIWSKQLKLWTKVMWGPDSHKGGDIITWTGKKSKKGTDFHINLHVGKKRSMVKISVKIT